MLTNQISLVERISNSLVESTTAQLSIREDAAFEELFKSHFRELHAYAYTIVKDELAAEEIVQSLFMMLWEKKTDLFIHTSLQEIHKPMLTNTTDAATFNQRRLSLS